jgi:hypothetical protein
MNRLTHRDLRGALHFLSACDAGSGLQAFGVSVAEALPKLISCDVAVFALANLRGQTMMAVENPRVTSAADLETYNRAFCADARCRGAQDERLRHAPAIPRSAALH